MRNAVAAVRFDCPIGDGVWAPGSAVPSVPGIYERQTPRLGNTFDAWDGVVWRRTTRARGQTFATGVECANQQLSWRRA